MRQPLGSSSNGVSETVSLVGLTTTPLAADTSAAETPVPTNRPATTSPAATSSRPAARPARQVSGLVLSTINRSFLGTLGFRSHRFPSRRGFIDNGGPSQNGNDLGRTTRSPG